MSGLSKVLSGVQALAAILALGAIRFWAPVCQKMLELSSGKEVHMKCFYAGQAGLALALILLLSAVLSFFAKADRKKLMIVSAAVSVMLFLTFGRLIGVCASADMACHTTAIWCRAAAVLGFAASLVDLIFDADGQIPQ